MTKKITILAEITPAVEDFAKRHGAYFDKGLQEWVVEGEVPPELESFVQKAKRMRDYVAERVPQCSMCGSRMILRPSARGEFWGCTAFPRCKGRRSLEEEDYESQDPHKEGLHLDKEEFGEFEHEPQPLFSSVATPVSSQADARTSAGEDPGTLTRAQAIYDRATQLFGDRHAAATWLKSPKVGLGHDRPVDVIQTAEGCNLVEKLLEERFEQAD